MNYELNSLTLYAMSNKKYALVTGASSGIGYEYAWVMADRGYNLIIVSNEQAINDKGECLRKMFPSVDIIPLVRDLSDQNSAKELHQYCVDNGLEVEVLINNAGVYHDKDFLDDTEGFTRLILNLHVVTPALLEYHFGKDMVSRGKGYILNMSSVTSNYGFQRMSTYSTTKGFIRAFSRATYIELKSKGVVVTCVRPGAVATPLYNLSESAMKTGLAIGAIITPRKLAEKGVRAMFRGKHEITPGFFTKFLNMVSILPTWLLVLVRKLGWF